MSLRDRVPVPPLSDERWERIERRIAAGAAAAPVHRSWSKLRFAVVAVAAASVVLAIGLNLRGARSHLTVPSSQPVAVTAGAGGSRIDLGDATLDLGPAAALRIERGSDRIAISLATGTVDFEVAPRRERPPFVVRAADVTVTVVGTAFTVERTDRIRVAVRHGRVRVDHQGQTRMLDAGQEWSAPLGPLPAAPAGTSTAEGRAAAAGARPGAAPSPSSRADDAPPSGSPPPAATAGSRADDPRLVSESRTGSSRAVAAPEAPRSAAGSGTSAGAAPSGKSGGSRSSRAGSGTADHHSRTATDATDDLAAHPLAPILALDVTAPADMIRRYATIVAGDDSRRAAHALYSMAWVHHFRLGQPDRALQILEAYDRRFPRGHEADSALWLRIRILCATRPEDACRAAAHTFLARFPADPRARIAEHLVNRRE